METSLRNLLLLIAGVLVLVGVGLGFLAANSTPKVAADPNRVEGFVSLEDLATKTACQLPAAGASLDDFAKCTKASGAIFYGAFWCPHCQDEKELFGDSAQYLPYVECSTPDGNNQLPVCAGAGVKVYPTWQFK